MLKEVAAYEKEVIANTTVYRSFFFAFNVFHCFLKVIPNEERVQKMRDDGIDVYSK